MNTLPGSTLPGPPPGPPPPFVPFVSFPVPPAPAEWGMPVKVAKELRSLPDVTNATIRVFAPITLGMGILCLLSGGWCVVSSVLVIVQGAVWLSVTTDQASLAESLARDATTSGSGCCGGPLSNLRGLAISGIVFACLEIPAALGIGFTAGLFSLSPTGACVTRCDGWSGQCQTTCTNAFFASGVWLVYSAGASLICGALNISMSVATLHLHKMLSAVAFTKADGASQRAHSPAAAQSLAVPNPAFGTMVESSA
jgi:uncharacterized membrane protein